MIDSNIFWYLEQIEAEFIFIELYHHILMQSTKYIINSIIDQIEFTFDSASIK
jgi:hypothetical protein